MKHSNRELTPHVYAPKDADILRLLESFTMRQAFVLANAFHRFRIYQIEELSFPILREMKGTVLGFGPTLYKSVCNYLIEYGFVTIPSQEEMREAREQLELATRAKIAAQIRLSRLKDRMI